MASRNRWQKWNTERRGLTVEEYERMEHDQKGLCHLCNTPERAIYKGKVRRLAIDHDHKTKIVRSLLCTRCNIFVEKIEWARNNPELAIAIAAYLDKHTARVTIH